jgi:hypothetical protein
LSTERYGTLRCPAKHKARPRTTGLWHTSEQRQGSTRDHQKPEEDLHIAGSSGEFEIVSFPMLKADIALCVWSILNLGGIKNPERRKTSDF